MKITPIPPSVGTVDSVGPPDPISNIRPVRFYVPPDETAVEKSFRLQRSEVLEWNQMFWRDHNSRYFKVNCFMSLNNNDKENKISWH